MYDRITTPRIDRVSVDRLPDPPNDRDRAICFSVTSSDVVRTKVDSSSIDSLGYSATSRLLEVTFLRGALYRYFEVPEHIFREFLSAPSKGTYFNVTVRNRFQYERA